MFFKQKSYPLPWGDPPPPSTNLPLNLFCFPETKKIIFQEKKNLPPPHWNPQPYPTFHQPTPIFFCFPKILFLQLACAWLDGGSGSFHGNCFRIDKCHEREDFVLRSGGVTIICNDLNRRYLGGTKIGKYSGPLFCHSGPVAAMATTLGWDKLAPSRKGKAKCKLREILFSPSLLNT